MLSLKDLQFQAEGKIQTLKEEGTYRNFSVINRQAGSFPVAKLRKPNNELQDVVVWCSNDYLGMGQHPKVLEAAGKAILKYGAGAGGSRNIGGTNDEVQLLEEEIASWLGRERSLVFPTGYGSNDASIESLITIFPNLQIFSDELNHASIIAGVRRSKGVRHIFRHNDAKHLESLLDSADPHAPKLVILESVYSMDGDIAPLADIVHVAKSYESLVFLDEAHAIGMYGPEGRGIAASLGLSEEIDIIQGTLAKAIGVIGGFVAGADWLIDAIRCFAPGFIFTTAMPPSICAAARTSISIIRQQESSRRELADKTERLREIFIHNGIEVMPQSETHVLPILIGSAHRCTESARILLEDYGIYVQPINAPTVPVGTSRFRINVTPTHTEQQMEYLASSLAKVMERVPNEQ